MSAAQIRHRLEAILEYLQPHWEWVNCHMVAYLTDNHWERYVPLELRAEIGGAPQVRDCIESVFWSPQNQENASRFPAFLNFISNSRSFHLENCSEVLTDRESLGKLLGKAPAETRISIREFMSEKKRHEVEITAVLVNDLIQHCLEEQPGEEVFVVDAGDGKGYLSSRLALEFGHKVLGIDSNATNTEQALARNKKLQRAWNGLTERAELENKGIKPPRRGKKPKISHAEWPAKPLDNYKTTSKFITSDLNLVQLLEEFFPLPESTESEAKEPAICLSGLHTCGNLAPTCLKVFHTQQDCKILVNIGCCYHLLKEEFTSPEFFGNKGNWDLQTTPGFPMSKFLQERETALGRNARMLAAQSMERTLAAKGLPNISLYHRALLEVLICAEDATLKGAVQVGKIRKYESFEEYLQLCAKRSNLDCGILQSSKVAAVTSLYEEERHFLDLFYLLRMTFAPVLESLILLDRLLYLKELGYAQSHLVSVFDAVVSPRHYGIVAIKE